MTRTRALSTVCLAAFTALVVTATAAAGAREAPMTRSPGWADERSVSSALERRGVVHAGLRRPIRLASCLGLHRHGVRVASFYEHFHRFRCRLWARDGSRYVAWVQITQSRGDTFWWIAYRTRSG